MHSPFGRDAETAGVVENLGLRLGSAGSWALPQHPSLTVTNPPWGQRLSDAEVQRICGRFVRAVRRLVCHARVCGPMPSTACSRGGPPVSTPVPLPANRQPRIWTHLGRIWPHSSRCACGPAEQRCRGIRFTARECMTQPETWRGSPVPLYMQSQCNESAVNVLCGTGSKYATRHLRMKVRRPASADQSERPRVWHARTVLRTLAQTLRLHCARRPSWIGTTCHRDDCRAGGLEAAAQHRRCRRPLVAVRACACRESALPSRQLLSDTDSRASMQPAMCSCKHVPSRLETVLLFAAGTLCCPS